MPDAPRAIRAVFSEWRMVKTRKVLALIFEVPLEQQGEVLTMLGAPMPDQEIWCGIAKMTTEAVLPTEGGVRPPVVLGADGLNSRLASDGSSVSRSQRGRERYLHATASQQALIRAVRLPKDERFRDWVAKQYGTSVVNEETAAGYIRDACCDGGSRRSIADPKHPDHYKRYLAVETEFKLAVNELAEPH